MFAQKSISRILSVLFVIVFMLAVTPLQVARAAGVRYAKPAASGAGDCLSWANACTLQTALTGAVSGDEIWVAAGTHKPATGTDRAATFQLKSGVALYGGFAGTETARGQRNPAVNVTVLSGDIDNNDSQTPIITDLATVTGNTTNSYHVVTGATGATLDGFTITAGSANDTAPNDSGAGMYNSSSSPTLTNVTFSGNRATYGGGVYNSSSSPTLTNVTFSGNQAGSYGGGVYNASSSPTLTNVIFSGNSAYAGGGGMYNTSGSNPTLTNVTFSSNTTSIWGGGMYNSSGSNPTLTNVTFSGNSGSDGSGMYNSSSSPVLTNVTFSGNSLAVYGSGMYNSSSSPALTNVAFSGNSADWGGGMYNTSGSNPRLTNVTFSGNSAYYGGGMYNDSSSPTLTNVTFSGNSADYGGGMENATGSHPTLTNVTFSGNRAGSYGGGMYNYGYGSNPTLVNCILWGNTPNQIYDDSSTPAVTYSDMQGGYTGAGNINADPQFVAPITATAAPTTTGNYRLYACSPAIDAGNSSAITVPTDLDGNARVMGAAVDMGAYETAPAPIACLTLTKSVAPLAAAPGGPITYTLTFRNKGPAHTLTATAVIITDIVPISVTNTSVLNSGPVITQVTGTRYVWQVQDLAPGQGGVITITGYLSPAPPVSPNILNTAVITTGVSDGYPADNTSAATFHIVIYVDQDAPGPAHNGLSWTTAYTDVQQALTAAMSGDEIWVAAGTYKPTTGTDRAATFQLKSGVALYGGFARTETARNQRNPAVNVTILSGDIDNNDSQTPIITDLATVTGNTTNSYHVVTGATSATLDGFTITAGYANGTSPDDSGAGMYNLSGSNPTLTNVTFSGNSAKKSGGGMYNNGSPTLTNVTFSGNSAYFLSTAGGGMFNAGSPTLTNVTFSGNSAESGGGMYNSQYASPTLTNVTFSGNSAYFAGGMYNFQSHPTLTNVTFSGNSAYSGGGMVNFQYANPTLTNVTFSGNSATGDYGGGMFNLNYANPTIRNTIFWGNTAHSAGSQIYNNGSSSVVSDSVVQARCPAESTCTNIIITDPRLGPLGNYGGSTQTIPLLPGSSAIDTGNDAICPATDQRGAARPHGAHCDIGAFEYYELDTTPPMVNFITRLNPSPTKLASVGFTVTFSESVTGVDVSDFSLTTAGVSGASVTGVTGSRSVYTVTVNTGSGTGTLRLDVTDDDSIVDMGGNPLGGTGMGNGNFTRGETYDVRFHLIYLPLVLRF